MWHLCCRCWLSRLSVFCLIYSQWLQRKRRKRRRELAKKRQKKVFKFLGFFLLFLLNRLDLTKTESCMKLLADSVMMTSAGSEGCDRNGLCVTWFNTDGCLSKHKTHTSECEGSIWKYLLPAWNIDFYPCCFLIMPRSRAAEEAVGGGGRGEAEADICAR